MKISTAQLKQLLASYAKVSDEEAELFVDALIQTVLTHLKQGEEVSVPGLGVFYFVDSQQGRRVAFSPDERMKEMVNAPFSFFEPVTITPGRIEDPVPEAPALEMEAQRTKTDEEGFDETNEILDPVSPIVPYTPSESVVDPEPEPEPELEGGHRSHRPLWWIMAASVLLAVVAVAWFVSRPQSAREGAFVDPPVLSAAEQNTEVVPVAAEAVTESESVAESSSAMPEFQLQSDDVDVAEEKDAPVQIPETKSRISEKTVPEPPVAQQIQHLADGSPLFESLASGERLTLLSERLFGNKCFWGYIFEVNAFQLRDPNNVPVGRRLYVPDPQYYGITAGDSVSERRARQKSHDILKAYSKNE